MTIFFIRPMFPVFQRLKMSTTLIRPCKKFALFKFPPPRAVRINGTKIPHFLSSSHPHSLSSYPRRRVYIVCTTKPGRSCTPHRDVLHQKITVRNHRESNIQPHQSIHAGRVSRVLTSSPGQILFLSHSQNTPHH